MKKSSFNINVEKMRRITNSLEQKGGTEQLRYIRDGLYHVGGYPAQTQSPVSNKYASIKNAMSSASAFLSSDPLNRVKNAELQKENTDLKKENADLKTENTDLKDRLAKITKNKEEQLNILKRIETEEAEKKKEEERKKEEINNIIENENLSQKIDIIIEKIRNDGKTTQHNYGQYPGFIKLCKDIFINKDVYTSSFSNQMFNIYKNTKLSDWYVKPSKHQYDDLYKYLESIHKTYYYPSSKYTFTLG